MKTDTPHFNVEAAAFAGLILITLTLLGFTISLQRHNRRLVLQLQAMSAADGPTVGSHISILHGQSISHKEVEFNTSTNRKQTLLLVFSPSCPYCKRNLPSWQQILTHISGVDVVYLDLSGSITSTYLANSGLPQTFPLVTLAPEERLLYNLRVTPTTVLLNPSGGVQGKWVGVMSSTEIAELYHLLGHA